MANNSSSSSSGGVGFFGLMFLILMTLKLTNYIDWSWWWVTVPLWGGFALIFIVAIIVIIIKALD
jgi:hypothetical protein